MPKPNNDGLTPQARKIYGHLKVRGTISPLEAQGAYGVTRLAARVNEIRNAGYPVSTQLRHDAAGHRYARYTLASMN